MRGIPSCRHFGQVIILGLRTKEVQPTDSIVPSPSILFTHPPTSFPKVSFYLSIWKL